MPKLAGQLGACTLSISPIAACSCWATVASSRNELLGTNQQAQDSYECHTNPEVKGYGLGAMDLLDVVDGRGNIAPRRIRLMRAEYRDDDDENNEPVPDAK
jgi:hypothetical protein